MSAFAIAICRVRWPGFVTSWASASSTKSDEPLRQPHHVALRVPDPEAAQAALRAAGVSLRPLGPNLAFEGPEGTVFHFMPARAA